MRAKEFIKLLEAAIKPDQLSQLGKLKQDLLQKKQQQHQQSMAVTPEKQAEIDAWARDFAQTHGSRTVAQDTPAPAAEPEKADWRTQPRMTKNKVRTQKQTMDAVISFGEKIMKAVERAERLPGGLSRELQSDLENIEHAFHGGEGTDYNAMLEMYSKFYEKLTQYIDMKRAVYRKPKTPRFEEDMAEGKTFGSKQEMIAHFVATGRTAAQGAAAWERTQGKPAAKKKPLKPPVRSYHDDLDDKRYGDDVNEMHTLQNIHATTGEDLSHEMAAGIKDFVVHYLDRAREDREYQDIDQEGFERMLDTARKLLAIHRTIHEHGLIAGVRQAHDVGVYDFITDIADNQGIEVPDTWSHVSEDHAEGEFCEGCGGSLDEAGKASRSLCLSSKPNNELGASQLSSCKSQGLRARETNKKHTIANKRVKIKGKKVRGHEYGGPLPYNKSDKTK
jgi:hypothetical protein